MAFTQRAIDATHSLIVQAGVKVKITSPTQGGSTSTTGVYASTQSSPQGVGATVQLKSLLYISAGRYVPQVGDFVNANARDYRIKTVEALYAQGKPVVYVLGLT